MKTTKIAECDMRHVKTGAVIKKILLVNTHLLKLAKILLY